MKRMTSLSIALMIPTLIASFLWDECGYSHRSDSTCLCSDNMFLSTPFVNGILYFPENKMVLSMKYGVFKKHLLHYCRCGLAGCRTEYSPHWHLCWMRTRNTGCSKSARRVWYSCCSSAFSFPKAVPQAYPENQSEKRTEQLSVFLFRPQGMDHHGPDDPNGNHHPRPPFITGKLHCRLLHRIIGCTECNRHPLPPVLVD